MPRYTKRHRYEDERHNEFFPLSCERLVRRSRKIPYSYPTGFIRFARKYIRDVQSYRSYTPVCMYHPTIVSQLNLCGMLSHTYLLHIYRLHSGNSSKMCVCVYVAHVKTAHCERRLFAINYRNNMKHVFAIRFMSRVTLIVHCLITLSCKRMNIFN